ncbi:MAG: hypothetical protein ACOCR0_01710 [Haloferacaceae archaeon]
MLGGWRYRVVSVVGVLSLTALAVLVANHPIPQGLFTSYVPVFWRLDPLEMTGVDLVVALAVTVAFVGVALVPMYKPRPRRILDTTSFAAQRVIVAMLGLATLGYYDFDYRLPRATLTMIGIILVVALPLWFV